MAIFDDIIDSVGKAGKFAYDKAVDAKDYVALEYRMTCTNADIDKCYAELGKYVYQNNKINDEIIEKINALIIKQDELLKEMSKFKKVCPNCAKRAGGNDTFCKNCGNKL